MCICLREREREREREMTKSSRKKIRGKEGRGSIL